MSLSALVARLLREPALRRINFACGPTPVYGGGYRIIANNVESGRIGVVRRAGATALYSYVETTTDRGEHFDADTLYLRAQFSERDPIHLGLLVHEATHALQDYHRASMDVGQAECAAYVAQAFYFLVTGTTWMEEARRGRTARGMPEENPGRDRLIEASHEPASRIFTTRGAYAVTEAEIATLRRAVRRQPEYAARCANAAGFDGF